MVQGKRPRFQSTPEECLRVEGAPGGLGGRRLSSALHFPSRWKCCPGTPPARCAWVHGPEEGPPPWKLRPANQSSSAGGKSHAGLSCLLARTAQPLQSGDAAAGPTHSDPGQERVPLLCTLQPAAPSCSWACFSLLNAAAAQERQAGALAHRAVMPHFPDTD